MYDYLAFDCNMPSGGKMFPNVLLLTLVCRRTQGQKEVFTTELEFFVVVVVVVVVFVVIILLLTQMPSGIVKIK